MVSDNDERFNVFKTCTIVTMADQKTAEGIFRQ